MKEIHRKYILFISLLSLLFSSFITSSKGITYDAILDQSNQSFAFTEIGRYDDNFGEPVKFSVIGDIAYCASLDGLLILDVSNPYLPTKLSFYDSIGSVNDVMVVNEVAFLATTNVGLEILNVSNPLEPVFISKCLIDESMMGIYVLDNYVFLSCNRLDLLIVDISKITNPTVIGEYDDPTDDPDFPSIPGYSLAVFVRDGYAIIADGVDYLNIINIQNPKKPFLVKKEINCFYPVDLHVVNNFLYVSEIHSGFAIYDINDMSNPVFLSNYRNESLDTWASDVFVSNNIAYIAEFGQEFSALTDYYGGLELVNVSDPYNPVHVTKILDSKNFHEVIVFNDLVYLFEDHNGLRIVDPNDIINPTIALYDFGGISSFITVEENYAYIVERNYGLEIIDISNPNNLFETGQIRVSGGHLEDIAVTRDIVFTLVSNINYEYNIHAFNISNPNNPFLIKKHTDLTTSFIEVTEDYLFMSGRWFDDPYFKGYKIESPYNLTLQDSLITNGVFVIQNEIVYLQNKEYELQLINISNPNDFKIISSIALGFRFASSIDISEDIIVISCGNLILVDVNNVQNPKIIATIKQRGNYFGKVFMYQDLLFAAVGDYYHPDYINIYNITKPNKPIKCGKIDFNNIKDFFYDGEFLYIAQGIEGLKIIQLDNLVRKLQFISFISIIIIVPFIVILYRKRKYKSKN